MGHTASAIVSNGFVIQLNSLSVCEPDYVLLWVCSPFILVWMGFIYNSYTPAQRSWRGGILESPCPSVCLSVCL